MSRPREHDDIGEASLNAVALVQKEAQPVMTAVMAGMMVSHSSTMTAIAIKSELIHH
jgi:hypothetical protein